MAVTPDTEIRLLKTPFEIDENNQLTFASESAQKTYFLSLPYLKEDNCTYQRKDNVIRFPAHIDSILDYNYVMYQNEHYTNKWFYAFITKMDYVNDNLTLITIETDVFQTWQFDIIYKKSFVEREHVNNDTAGAHTIPEGLETGDYIVDASEYDTSLDTLAYIIQSMKSTTGTDFYATNYGGVYLAGGAYICPDATTFVNIIQALAAYENAVFGAYVVPNIIVDNTSGTLNYSGQSSPHTYTKSFSKPTSLNGYTPVNKKLLTFPYCFMNISNNNGSCNSLRYENFHLSSGTFSFSIKGVPVPGGSIKCVPVNYGNSSLNNEEEGIMAGKFPTLSWSQDLYTNWLTQNGVNLSVGLSKEVLGTTAGNADLSLGEKITTKMAGMGMNIVGGSVGIRNKLAEVYAHSLSPLTAKGNTNGGDINTCSHKNGFTFYKMSIKQEYAKVIDNFFSMYGYKVNEVKIPNITGRSNWNYVKTVDINLLGNIPQEDMQKLKDIFNKGVTLWHNASTFLDYSQSNGII